MGGGGEVGANSHNGIRQRPWLLPWPARPFKVWELLLLPPCHASSVCGAGVLTALVHTVLSQASALLHFCVLFVHLAEMLFPLLPVCVVSLKLSIILFFANLLFLLLLYCCTVDIFLLLYLYCIVNYLFTCVSSP